MPGDAQSIQLERPHKSDHGESAYVNLRGPTENLPPLATGPPRSALPQRQNSFSKKRLKLGLENPWKSMSMTYKSLNSLNWESLHTGEVRRFNPYSAAPLQPIESRWQDRYESYTPCCPLRNNVPHSSLPPHLRKSTRRLAPARMQQITQPQRCNAFTKLWAIMVTENQQSFSEFKQVHACGLDFGTSNSTVAVAANNQVRLVPLEGNHTTMPSAIFFSFVAHDISFGRAAIRHYTDAEPGRFMRALKSILGHQLFHEETRIRGLKIRLSEVLTFFLGHLKRTTEQTIESEITDVVLGRPVQFIEDDAAADQKSPGRP